MPYCPACKVSLAEGAAFCPLCLGPSAAALEPPATAARVPQDNPVSVPAEIRNAEDGSRLSAQEARTVVMELLSVSVVLSLAITIAIDAILARELSWSRYVGLILAASWLFSFMPLLFWGRPWTLLAVLGPAMPLFPLVWGLFARDLSWFLPVGLPIALCIEAIAVSVLTLIGTMGQRGLNVPGIILAGAGLLCVAIDFVLNRYMHGLAGLSWSFVVVVSVIPVSGLFFYLHYRVTNKASLRKLFRL